MEKNAMQKFGFVVIALIAFLLFVTYSDNNNITGLSIASQLKDYDAGSNPLALVMVVLSILLFFFLVNKGSAKEIVKNVIGSIAIFIGLYVITKLVPTIELVVGLISLTFGIMAIFWTLKAHNALSTKSSLRRYTNISLVSLICILLYSLYEAATSIYGFDGAYVYPKYILISLAYIAFVYAAYTIDRIGKEFGFNTSNTTIKQMISNRKSKVK